MYGGAQEGPSAGITPRAIHEIFRLRERDKHKFDMRIRMYMLELYKDNLVDLLLPEKYVHDHTRHGTIA